MKPERAKFQIDSEMPWTEVAPGIQRKIMGYDNQIMLVQVKFASGAIASTHDHFHAQSSYVVSGKFELTIDGEAHILEAGDGFYMEPNSVHGGRCIEEGILIDTFSPVREDFL